MPIKIVTDSTASIPEGLIRALDIAVISVPVLFGVETFRDGIDPPADFYARLRSTDRSPTTSTPAPGAFLRCYQQVAAPGDCILSIHLMESKSALINTARLAAEMAMAEAPDLQIHVIDSQSTSMGLGILVMTAAQMAQQGCTATEIAQVIERLIARVDLYIAVRELTQLRRSGRVSLGQALLAGMLAIKPVIHIGCGQIEVVDKARGWAGAVDRIADLAHERAVGERIKLAVVHTNAEQEAHALLVRLRHRLDCVDALVAEAGPALAAHAGAGALGVVTLRL